MLHLYDKVRGSQDRQLSTKKLVRGGWIALACLLLALFSACATSVPGQQGTTGTGSTNQTSGNGSGGNNSSSGSSSNSGSASNAASGQVVPLDINITYSSVQITLIDEKQAKSFSDDTSASSSVLRLDIKENNQSTKTAYDDFSQVALLMLPNGTNVSPVATQQSDSSVGPDVNRTNWIDFPVPLSVKASQTSLQLGKATESQELIPLKSGADVSKYAAKSSNPNAKLTYGTTNWTVTTATSELSYGAVQADKGMMFVVLDLTADNTGSSDTSGDLVSVRLKSGDTTNPSQEFLADVAGNQTNVKSTLSFIMPQGSTSFSLIFLPSSAYGITTQSSADFQIS